MVTSVAFYMVSYYNQSLKTSIEKEIIILLVGYGTTKATEVNSMHYRVVEQHVL